MRKGGSIPHNMNSIKPQTTKYSIYHIYIHDINYSVHNYIVSLVKLKVRVCTISSQVCHNGIVY